MYQAIIGSRLFDGINEIMFMYQTITGIRLFDGINRCLFYTAGFSQSSG